MGMAASTVTTKIASVGVGTWEVIVSNNGGYLHALLVPGAGDRYPQWTRIVSESAPATEAMLVPDEVLETGMRLLRAACQGGF